MRKPGFLMIWITCYWYLGSCCSSPFFTNGISHKVWYCYIRMVQCIYRGVTGYNLKKNCISFSEDLFGLSKQCRPWCNASLSSISSLSKVFTVCQSTRLGSFVSKGLISLANSANPDEMPHNVAFHLGLHCLPKYPLWGLWSSKG